MDYYRGKDSLKRFCQDLKRQAKSIIDFEKKELPVLTIDKEFKHHMATKCYICEKIFYNDKNYNYSKVRGHCHYTGKYRGAAHKICNLMYNTAREIPVVFHNGSRYYYHFIIKGLVEESEGDFECLGENKEKYITFSVPIKEESNEDSTIIYRIKFIDSFRFMSTFLSTLVNNLSNKIIENGKCVDCKSCLEFIKIRNSGRRIFECFDCKRRYQKDIDDETLKKLKKNFRNTYNFCNKDINKFSLLLRKGVYPYEYMNDWDRFNGEKLPNKSDFYSSLNMEDISEIAYRHALKVFNKFNIKNLGEYHDLYIQSDTILLADVFESFRHLCLNTYKLDPAYFLSLPGLAWQACLKHSGIKLKLTSDFDMLLMLEEGIRGGICAIQYLDMLKQIINISKIMMKTKNNLF